MTIFYTMDHRGSLGDALTTKKEISEEVFNKLVDSGIYQFYCFDERINCSRFIICNIPENLGLPVWLLKEEQR